MVDRIVDAESWRVILAPESLPSLIALSLLAGALFFGWREARRAAPPPPSPPACGFTAAGLDAGLAPVLTRLNRIETELAALRAAPAAPHKAPHSGE